MARIDNTSALTLVLQRQLAALRNGGPSRTEAKKPGVGKKSKASGTSPELSDLLKSRIEILDPHDPERRSKAFRIFLETIFTRELGVALHNDPMFATMVGAVQQQILEDREMKSIVDTMVDQMLKR